MNRVLFFGAFLAAGIPMGDLLASADAEPDMAGLSLLVFCFVGAVVSLLTYIVSSYKLRRDPSALNGLCAGAVAAVSFFLTLSFVSQIFDLWSCLLMALILSASLAATAPLLGAKFNV
jgi:hypothetical protein